MIFHRTTANPLCIQNAASIHRNIGVVRGWSHALQHIEIPSIGEEIRWDLTDKTSSCSSSRRAKVSMSDQLGNNADGDFIHGL